MLKRSNVRVENVVKNVPRKKPNLM